MSDLREMSWYRPVINEFQDVLFQGGVLLTSREAADIIGRPKSTTAEFTRWVREVWLPEQQDVQEQEERIIEAMEDASEATITEGKSQPTWVADGLVYTDLGIDYPLFAMTKRDFEAARKDYSNLYGRGSLNQSQMSYKYGFASAHAVARFVKIHGWRQTSIPYTDEQLDELGVDAAVEETIASKRQSYLLKLQERERAGEKSDAEKWRTLELSIQGVMAGLQPLPSSENYDALTQPSSQPYAVMISLSDLHLGRLAHGADGQVIWNRKEAKRVAIAAVRDLLKQTLALGRPDEIMLLLASDGIHVDGPQMTTTGNTPQGEQSEGTYREMVEDYLALAQEAISICRAIAPVRALIVEGNHDRVTSMMIGLMLERLYAGDTRVSVETQRGSGLIQINYGENTLAFLHGEFLKRAGDLFKIMLATADSTGLPLMRHRLSWGGHLHHERVEDLGGIKHHTLTSLAPNDEWHRRSFWIGATLEAQAFVIRRSGGKGAVFYTSPQQEAI